MTRALITGIAGFAGSHLAEHLLAEGDEVAGLVLDPAPSPNLAAIAGRVKLIPGDLTDPAAVAAALDHAAPDLVYHLAGFASPRLSVADPLACYRVNAMGTAVLLDAMRRSGARPRVLVVSSGEVYGRAGPGPIPETAPLRPMSPYGASKAAAEMIALAAFASDGIPTIRARSFNHTGPRQEPVFAGPAFARQIAEAEAGLRPRELRVGNLAPVREMSNVRDVVRAYRLILSRGTPGEAYNVASGLGTTIRGFLDRLLERARVPLAVTEDPALFRAAEIDSLVGDPARLIAATGFRPTTPISETAAAVLDDWRARTGPSATGAAATSSLR